LSGALTLQAPGKRTAGQTDLLALPLRGSARTIRAAYLQQQLLICNGKVDCSRNASVWSARIYIGSCVRGEVDFRNISDD